MNALFFFVSCFLCMGFVWRAIYLLTIPDYEGLREYEHLPKRNELLDSIQLVLCIVGAIASFFLCGVHLEKFYQVVTG